MKRYSAVMFALAATGLIGCGSTSTTPPAQAPVAAPEAAEAPEPAPVVEDQTAEKLRAAVASSDRPENERARDAYRNPVETLEFFGLRDDMTVLELWPGGGWYTTILAPVLADKGKLIATNYDPNGPEDKPTTKYGKGFQARVEKEGERFSKVSVTVVDPPEKLDLGVPESVDMAVTFRNFHGWASQNQAEAILAQVHKVLKPGGVLGIVDHRAKADSDPATWAKSGYIGEAEVIRLVEAAGFKLEEKSELNANPKDTTDHPEGVWTLPPSLKLGDKDRAKYEEIGESDRMTLKFRKQ